MVEKDALDKLIIDEDENPDSGVLANLISKYLRFGKKSGEVIFNEEFSKLKDWQKILVYLLGRKGIVVKKLREKFSEKISPKDLSKEFGIPPKSISSYVSRELKGIIKAENGEYFIPNYNLYKCEEKLKEDGKPK